MSHEIKACLSGFASAARDIESGHQIETLLASRRASERLMQESWHLLSGGLAAWHWGYVQGINSGFGSEV